MDGEANTLVGASRDWALCAAVGRRTDCLSRCCLFAVEPVSGQASTLFLACLVPRGLLGGHDGGATDGEGGAEEDGVGGGAVRSTLWSTGGKVDTEVWLYMLRFCARDWFHTGKGEEEEEGEGEGEGGSGGGALVAQRPRGLAACATRTPAGQGGGRGSRRRGRRAAGLQGIGGDSRGKRCKRDAQGGSACPRVAYTGGSQVVETPPSSPQRTTGSGSSSGGSLVLQHDRTAPTPPRRHSSHAVVPGSRPLPPLRQPSLSPAPLMLSSSPSRAGVPLQYLPLNAAADADVFHASSSSSSHHEHNMQPAAACCRGRSQRLRVLLLRRAAKRWANGVTTA